MIGASKKLLQATAGNAGGGPLDVDEVFSTYLYDGFSGTKTIVNGIDLLGEGGLTWTKRRDSATYKDHILTSSGNGRLKSNTTDADVGSSWVASGFRSDGFNVVSAFGDHVTGNGSGKFVTWTFRKAPKFFDVVTWTGDGTTGRTISHSLDCDIGFISVKANSTTGNWICSHKNLTTNYCILLNSTAAEQGYVRVNNLTTTGFDVHDYSSQVGSANASGVTYVAYVFAHNDGDGEFGPDGDQDVIKCGSYTGNGSDNGPEIDLGFEPQWFMFKKTSGTGGWFIYDAMRGFAVDPSGGPYLWANSSTEEQDSNRVNPTSTGIKVHDSNDSWNENGATFIYIAIRRGPLAPPESATDVFALGDQTATSGFPVDSVLSTYFETYTNSNHMLYDRLRAIDGSRLLFTHSNAAENTSNPFSLSIASNTGIERNWGSGWNHKMFRRAPGFFDVLAYTGAGSNQTLKHNLTVKPELSIVKYRTGSYSISTYTSWGTNTLTDGTNNPTLFLDTDRDNIGNTNAYWQEATNTEIYVGGANNENSFTYIMYLFATLAGISKVGKYTGNGSSQTINCGFTSGARYVLIKRYDSAGDWYVWDTLRGIVAGNDPYMRLNVTTSEVTSNDSIDPASSGFIVNQVSATNINVSGAKYAYYSVA